MIRPIASLILICLGTQLSALSCAFPDISETYAYLDDHDETYAVLLGQISYDVDGYSKDALEAGVTVQGRFEGVQVGKNRNFSPLSTDITVKVQCDSTWGCGYVDRSPDTISFVQMTDHGLLIQGSICPGRQYPNADPAYMDKLQRCMSGGWCRP